jgi:hypothetical protein
MADFSLDYWNEQADRFATEVDLRGTFTNLATKPISNRIDAGEAIAKQAFIEGAYRACAALAGATIRERTTATINDDR